MPPNVMLNLFQHLAASLLLSFSADRSCTKFRMTVYFALSSFLIEKKNAASNVSEAAQGIGFIENS